MDVSGLFETAFLWASQQEPLKARRCWVSCRTDSSRGGEGSWVRSRQCAPADSGWGLDGGTSVLRAMRGDACVNRHQHKARRLLAALPRPPSPVGRLARAVQVREWMGCARTIRRIIRQTVRSAARCTMICDSRASCAVVLHPPRPVPSRPVPRLPGVRRRGRP